MGFLGFGFRVWGLGFRDLGGGGGGGGRIRGSGPLRKRCRGACCIAVASPGSDVVSGTRPRPPLGVSGLGASGGFGGA